MAAYRLLSALCLLSIPTATCWAEEFTLAFVGKVHKAEGYYEYNKDGVPLIGLVTARVNVDRVKFTSCNNTTIEVDFKHLKRSDVECLADDKRRRDYGPWTTASKSIAPLLKVEAGAASTVVNLEGQNVDLSGLPASYKELLRKAKPGEPVGFAFTGDDGQKSFAIIDAGPRG